MGRFLPIFSFLVVAIATSHAALPAQIYWHAVLPNTPMPSAIRDLLHPDAFTDEMAGTSVNVGKGMVNVNTGKGKPSGTNGVGGGGGGGGVNVNVGKGVSVYVGPKGKGKPLVVKPKPPVVVKPKPPVVVKPKPTFNYVYAATETQIHDDPNVALFFQEKDLRPGSKMVLHFTRTTSGAAFLPRKVANSIPFTSTKLPEVLIRFSVEPNTVEAEAMKNTLHECEEPAVGGETKYCATSLESMVDFSTSSLGTSDVRAVSTVVGKEETPKQKYTIAPSGVRPMAGNKLVACHAQTYAYAVFYCHATSTTKAYTVAMEGKDGTAVEAVAVCHTDTAKWNPKHVAFQVLKVKPGTVPVCHFLPQDHVVWSPNN